MLRFRNITATPADPVETWGTEGILTALERGTLTHFNQIARAAKNPESDVAREFEEAASLCERPFPVTYIRNKLRVFRATPEELVAMRLRTAQIQLGVTQAEFAKLLGTSASRLSTYLSAKVTPSAAVLVTAERLVARDSRRALTRS